MDFYFLLFFALLLDLPVNKLAALEFLERNLLSFAMLILPFDDLMPAGANFKALAKLDFDTPKSVATSLVLCAAGEPWANAVWILLLLMTLTSSTVFADVIELDVVEPAASALEVFELVPLEALMLFMFSSVPAK